MKIAINALMLKAPSIGVVTYLKNLLKNFPDDGNEYVQIKSGFFSKPPKRTVYEQFAIPYIVNHGKFDVFHNPDHTLPILPIKCKKVITVHDLAFIKHPNVFSFQKYLYKRFITPLSIKNADKIIADSENTKKDILDIFNVEPSKVQVIYLGADQFFKPIQDKILKKGISIKYGLDKPFILSVGTLEPRKNLKRLINSYLALKNDKKIDHELIIVGKKGWLYKELMIETEGVRILENVDSEDLPVIYNCADIFVYPSIYEGFGLPVLEAMSCGVPVIASNSSSIPEVLGDSGILVDPYNEEELGHSILKVLSDSSLKSDMSKKGVERAKIFSWEKTAIETARLYSNI